MKRFIRALTLLLTLATVTSAMACVQTPQTDDTTAAPEATVSETTIGDTTAGSTTADETTENENTEPPSVILTDEMTEEPTSEPATDTTSDPDSSAPDTTPEPATTEEQTEPATTVTETVPVTTAKPKEKTANPKKAMCQPVNDGKQMIILIYCEVEDFSTVYVCDYNGNILIQEIAYGPLFYGMYLLPAGTKKTVYIYAKAEDKTISGYTPLTLKYNSDGSAGYGAFVGKDSMLYYNGYDSFYYGQQSVSTQRMAEVKGYLENKLANVRAQTGKNTKIIIIICTNPATIYHDRQYSEAEGGRGDYFTSTPTTQFAEYMKGNNNIYVIDLRDILMQHKAEGMFDQCDSHWTEVAGYYAYYSMLQYVKKDYSNLPTLSLKNDCTVTYSFAGGGGDLLSFTGGGARGMQSWGPTVSIKNGVTLPSNAPTAYVMGDSYYWAISQYFGQAFSTVYLNSPDSNPPLYDYSLNDLSAKKPDYLVYMWTERNVDGNLGIMVN